MEERKIKRRTAEEPERRRKRPVSEESEVRRKRPASENPEKKRKRPVSEEPERRRKRPATEEPERRRKRPASEVSEQRRRTGEERPVKKRRPEAEGERVKRVRTDADGERKARRTAEVPVDATARRRRENTLTMNNRDVEKLMGRSESKQNKNGNGRKNRRKNYISRNIGLGLVGLQIIATLVFLAALMTLGMIPEKFMVAIGALLGAFALLSFTGQFFSKKKAIAGKLFSFLMSVVLFIGSSYIFKTSGAIGAITGGNLKTDKMVVAVLTEDTAETIQDAASYNFGVQYAVKGDDVKQTVKAINEEIGSEIQTTECTSIQEQAEKLHDGSVQAIVLNEAYSDVLEEEFGDFSSKIKIIYSYEIKTEIDTTAEKVEVQAEPFVVYISGIDVYGSITTNSRSDVNILAVVNPETHQVLLVTTPRDYYVPLSGISGGTKDKLTHAGIYGVDVSMATLADLYGTEAEFYARVNFTSLIEMVNALGGVDVYSEYAFTTNDKTLTVSKGWNHFNGKQALAFSRERYNVPGGDFQRGRNQQAVITAMIQKAISPAILTGANELLNSVSGNVDTNMSQKQIQSLIKSQLSDAQPWKIKSMSANGTGSKNYCYSMPGTLLYVTEPDYASVTEIAEAIKAVKNGETFDDSTVAE